MAMTKRGYPTIWTSSSYQNSYNKSYFEAARSPKKRSLLGVNEHFEGEADAKRALLDGFSEQFRVIRMTTSSAVQTWLINYM